MMNEMEATPYRRESGELRIKVDIGIAYDLTVEEAMQWRQELDDAIRAKHIKEVEG